MKGQSLVAGQVALLSLDGTLVYVEGAEPSYLAVVALPDQPPERADERVFTPGRVGAKKISPMASADKVVPVAELSDRNREFIAGYEALRAQHGPNFVSRTPEEEAALAAANAPRPAKAARVKRTPEEKALAKAAKKAAKGGPRYFQKCTQCGQPQGHPDHPSLHEFVAPPMPVIPPALCAACDKPEADHASVAGDAGLGHRYVAGKAARAPKPPREAKVREPRQPKPSAKATLDPTVKHRWVGTDANYEMLIAVNPKFGPKNSGGTMIESLKEADLSISEVLVVLAQHPRWCGVPMDRVVLAFGQLLGAKLIEPVA